MRTLAAVALLAAYVGNLNAQVLQQNDRPTGNRAMAPAGINSFVLEGFEGEQFPPPGWTFEYTGSLYWALFRGASAYGVGSASATFNIWYAPAGTTQSLVLSSMGASVPGDSIRFDHAYATYSGENDQLIIETSTNGGTTYTTLVTLNGGERGSLVTADPTTTQFVPSAGEWATKRYALPVGTNKVRFKAVSAFGNDLYIDNCRIGTQSAVDAGVQSIDIPNPIVTLSRVPKVTVQNHGPTPATFAVTLLISPDGYSSVKTVTSLPGNEKSTVLFDSWTPAIGTHNLTAFTTLSGDVDRSNDTLRSAVLVNGAQQVSNISALPKAGQVFVTWDNLTMMNVAYTLYKSPGPIQHGFQLSSAQNLGNVRDNSALNKRLTQISGGVQKYLKIDSASSPLASTKGLFVATTTASGSFYYAVTPTVGGVEDTTIVVGSNALASPVSEGVMMPQPVWQESRDIGGKTFNIYVQFVTKVTSSIYPQMTNAGSYPFHFALVKSGTQSPYPVTFWMHPQGETFLDAIHLKGIGHPNEWVVTIDDWIPSNEYDTGDYGYHENFDIQSDQNQVPSSGILYNYTSARVAHTVNWAIRNLPVDSTRTYMTGWSMGAIGTMLNALVIPTRIAAIFVYCPRIDMSTWGGYVKWGAPGTDLLTNEGYHKSERLNATFLARVHRSDYLPIMYTFCGKNDINVGWDEKPPFYDSLNAYRHGGFHFWSMTDHGQTFSSSPWQPNFPNFAFFTRYRTNLSYPAFSNCSINHNPGNGVPLDGVPTGTINGHLDWNDNIVDVANRWEITLKLKDLSTIYGSDLAPDSATTDVTLRRLQAFSVQPRSIINWENRRNNIVVQHASFVHDSGLVTIPGVKVYKDSSRLVVTYTPEAVAEQNAPPRDYELSQNYPNPFNPATTIRYNIPHRSQVFLAVFNTLGQQVATLVQEDQDPGYHQVRFDARNLASGVYFYRLQAGDFVQSKKLMILK
jgi:hypothetical protein